VTYYATTLVVVIEAFAVDVHGIWILFNHTLVKLYPRHVKVTFPEPWEPWETWAVGELKRQQ
jgi:3-methyladenine DNA glycosylase/8-oxoguanine DNA glycosylase